MHLCVQNAAFAWPGRPALFENLSFSIQTPSVTSVLGPNGAGKTTLLKCVLGFEKWTAGSETLDGIETSRLAPRGIRASGQKRALFLHGRRNGSDGKKRAHGAFCAAFQRRPAHRS